MTDYLILASRIILTIFLLIVLWREKDDLCDIWRNTKHLITQAELGRSLLVILFLFVFAVFWIPHLLSDYALNAWTELLSILVGAILIDRLRRYETNRLREEREEEAEKLRKEREREEEKRYQKRLRLQARSRLKNNALDAIDIIRAENWLQNDDELALLQGQNLSNADLSEANLLNANLTNTHFEKANLNGTDLRNADLTGAVFKNAELIGTQLVGAKLLGTDFTGATLTSKAIQDEKQCRFKPKPHKPNEHDIRETSIELNPENPIIFQESRIHGIAPEIKIEEIKDWKQWKDWDLKHFIDLTGLVLSKVSFEKASLDIVNLKDSLLVGSNFINATFNRVYLTGAELNYAIFSREEDGNTIYATIKNSKLDFVQLKKAILNGVIFRKCDFVSADLSNSYCRGTNFIEVNFHNAVLSDMQIERAKFKDILLNGDTIFFDGVSLDKKWLELHPSYAEEYDLEKIKELFEDYIINEIKQREVQEFKAIVDVHQYTYDEKDDGDMEDTGDSTDNNYNEQYLIIKEEGHRYAISIEIKYTILPSLKVDSFDDYRKLDED